MARGGGTYSIPQGTLIRLAPHPDSGAALKGWGEGCAGSSLDGCGFTGDELHYVAAAFGQAVHGEGSRTLTVIVSGYTSLRSTPPGINCVGTCSASFPAGTLVALD